MYVLKKLIIYLASLHN